MRHPQSFFPRAARGGGSPPLQLLSRKEQKAQKEVKDRVGIDPVVGKLAIIFRGLFALATRDEDRKENRRVRCNTVFRYLAVSDIKNDTSACSLNLHYKIETLFIITLMLQILKNCSL